MPALFQVAAGTPGRPAGDLFTQIDREAARLRAHGGPLPADDPYAECIRAAARRALGLALTEGPCID